MRKTNWKDIAELIGITAIVASLIFVGLELRQSRDIAVGEGALANAANSIELSNAFRTHAEVWVKGRAGGELDEVERVIFRSLVQDENDKNFFNFRRVRLLGDDYAADTIIFNMSRFLIDNPGARQVWTDNETARDRSEKLTLNRDDRFGFADAVRSTLEKLEGSPE